MDEAVRELLDADRALVAEATSNGVDAATVAALADTLGTLAHVHRHAGAARADAARGVAFTVLLSLVKDSPIPGHRALAALLARELEAHRAQERAAPPVRRRTYSEPLFAR